MIKTSVIILALLLSVSGWAKTKSVTHSHAGRVHSHPLPKEGIKHRHGSGAFGTQIAEKKKSEKVQQKRSGATIKMKRYTVENNLGRDWDLKTFPQHQVVEFKQVEKKGWQPTVSRAIVVIEKDASRIYGGMHSERWVADNFRKGEESNMIAQGVMKGMYQLKDVKKSETNIHNKHFYTMTYKTYRQYKDSHVGHGYLYIYFPSDFKEKNIFYSFLYSEVKPLADKREIDLSDFYSILGGFNVQGKNQ